MSLRTVTIDVTQEDIDEGERYDCNACPVARAVRRHLQPGWLVSVSPLWIYVYREGQTFGEGVHPEPLVRDFIDLYDAGHYVPPSRFPFELPEECLR